MSSYLERKRAFHRLCNWLYKAALLVMLIGLIWWAVDTLIVRPEYLDAPG